MEEAAKEMTWREKTIADAQMHLKFLNMKIETLSKERADVLHILKTLEIKTKPMKKKLAHAPKPQSKLGKVETVDFFLYGRSRKLRKPVLDALLSLGDFSWPNAMAQVEKWHSMKSKKGINVTANSYIQYLVANGFVESYRNGKYRRYKVVKKENDSLAAMVEEP